MRRATIVRSLLCTFGVGPTLGEIENLNACAPACVQATRGSALSAATDDISWSQTSDEQRQGSQVPLREVRLPRVLEPLHKKYKRRRIART